MEAEYDVTIVKEDEYGSGFTLENAEKEAREQLGVYDGCIAIVSKRVKSFSREPRIMVKSYLNGCKYME